MRKKTLVTFHYKSVFQKNFKSFQIASYITVFQEIPFTAFTFQNSLSIKNVKENINRLEFYLNFTQNQNFILDFFSTWTTD